LEEPRVIRRRGPNKKKAAEEAAAQEAAKEQELEAPLTPKSRTRRTAESPVNSDKPARKPRAEKVAAATAEVEEVGKADEERERELVVPRRALLEADHHEMVGYTPPALSTPGSQALVLGREVPVVLVKMRPGYGVTPARARETGDVSAVKDKTAHLPANTTIGDARKKLASKYLEKNPNNEYFCELETREGRGAIEDAQTLGQVLAAGETNVTLFLCVRGAEDEDEDW
jgi:hypothetical protein